MLPVEGLVYERCSLGTSAAEDHSGYRNALGVVELAGDAGAILCGSSEAGVGVCKLIAGSNILGSVYVLALPLDGVYRRVLV